MRILLLLTMASIVALTGCVKPNQAKYTAQPNNRVAAKPLRVDTQTQVYQAPTQRSGQYQQPTYQQPTYQQPTYQQPTYQTPPKNQPLVTEPSDGLYTPQTPYQAPRAVTTPSVSTATLPDVRSAGQATGQAAQQQGQSAYNQYASYGQNTVQNAQTTAQNQANNAQQQATNQVQSKYPPLPGMGQPNCKRLVVINARNTAEGLAMQNAWIGKYYPNGSKSSQKLGQCGNKMVDVVTISKSDGTSEQVTFDISSFFKG